MRPTNGQEVAGFLLRPFKGGVDGDVPAESIAELWVRLNFTMDISRSLMPQSPRGFDVDFAARPAPN